MPIQVVDRYTLPPGCCLVCYGSHLPAVSTGIDIHQPGALQDAEVVICHKCVLHMAREVGKRIGYMVISIAEMNEHEATLVELHAQIVALNDERDKAYHARNALLASLGETQWVPTVEPEPTFTVTGVMTATVTPPEELGPIHGPPPPKKRTR